MNEASIDLASLQTWARILIEHSMGGVAPGERVMIKGERICWPLLAELETGVIAAGGVPDVLLVPPNNERGRVWSATMARVGSSDQLAAVPAWHRARYESMVKYIEVLGAEDPAAYADLSSAQVQALAAADRPYTSVRLGKRWAVTLYPTPAFAAMEGVAFDEYVRFIVQASTTDPRPLKDAEERLAPLFASGRAMRVMTVDRAGKEWCLELDIAPSIPALSYGLRNFPDGEIYTSPDARRTTGAIFLDLPVHYGGHDIRGIFLRFDQGRIIEYRAEEGHAHLAAIVETDEGSHRLGEIALGMNPAFERAFKHPLLVEKVGGTLHLAIGASYETCYVDDSTSEAGRARIAELEQSGALNRSAQHVDIVADFRPGGSGRAVFIDDRQLTIRERVWVAGE
jgi:aminopeptidase